MPKRIKNIPKRIMFQLDGREFASLIKREFTAELMTTETSIAVKNVFECRTKSLRDEDFDILNFTSSFQDDFKINNLQDTTHVSLHYQISGKSDAYISGFGKILPMDKGRFNLLNCVDPVSTFVFPKQQVYEYLCVGLKPSFFRSVLADCGPAYENMLERSHRGQAFSLYNPNSTTDHLQHDTLNLLQRPPVADNLKTLYIRSKVKELILLTISAGSEDKKLIAVGDTDKLNAVKAYLTVNYLSVFTLESISKTFGLNEFKLKSGFKKLFGYTVFGYIHQLRMEHAFTLLSSGGFSIGEVAAIIGYTSDSAFIRAYKLQFGYTPGKHQLFA
jgi:AraC family transcriptional activator of pyochelin receptor